MSASTHMRAVAGLLFVASAWSGSALAAGGYTKLEESELTKLYGLRRSIDLPRATALLKIGLEEHIAPIFSEDGSLIFVGSGNRKLRCISVETGKVLWKRGDLGGIGRHMAVHGDTLIVGSDQDLVGLQAYSGKTLWKTSLGGLIGGEITVEGNLAVIPMRPNSYVAAQPSDGKIRWRYKRPSPDGITIRGQAPATFGGDSVYVAGWDGVVSALHVETGMEQWRTDVSGKAGQFKDVDCRPLLLDKGRRLLVASYNGGVAALDSSNGKEVWRNADMQRITGWTMSPGASLITASHGDGEVLGLSTRTAKARWRYRIESGVPTTPKILRGHAALVVSTSGPAAIVSVDDGRPQQILTAGSGASAGAAVHGDDIAIYTNKSTLLLFGLGRGTRSTP